MPSADFQKRLILFLFLSTVLIAALVFFPSDQTVRWYLAEFFGLSVSDGSLVALPGEAVPMMAEKTIGAVESLVNLLKILLWMALVVTIVRFVLFLVSKTLHRASPQGDVSSLLKTVLSIVVYVVAFFIIFQSQFPKVELAPLFTGSTIIGIVVGLALQDTLGNLFSGLALQADQSFQVGDVISVGSIGTGVVEKVSWRGVKIRTFQNKLLVISNAAMGKEAIEVAPKNNLNARLVFFTTVYSAAPSNIAARIREAVRTSENVSQKMRPIVRIRSLGTDGLDWEIKYWLEDYSKYNDSDAMIRQRIWYACKRENIDFAFPTRTLHIAEKGIKPLPEEIIDRYVEHLNNVSIFSPLSEDELVKLANSSSRRVYAPGEAIVRLGQEGNSMFVIISGSVKVEVPEGTGYKTIGTLAENDFFGEMSLLTGQPRSANVVALVETEVLRIDKIGVKPIFEANPSIVESMSEIVDERRAAVDAQIAGQEEQQAPTGRSRRLIRKFFGLR